MKRGLIVGKFYPFHKGHQHLVETGIKSVDKLTVVVCTLNHHTIEGEQRAVWIRELYPEIEVLVRSYDHVDPDDSKVWAGLAIEWMGGSKPDVVFTSEEYGERWAKEIGCEHVLVDMERAAIPISGTKVRENPLLSWDYLSEPVRGYFAKRVCILGAESTGTTTLAMDLAKHYQTVWVPEFGRLYSEARKFDGSGRDGYLAEWKTQEFVHIAQMQNQMEDQLARKANKVLICDTDSFATNVWHRRYMGKYSKEVEKEFKGRKYDLYIVTDVDIPFVQDGLRDGEKIREWMHDEFIKQLKKWKKPFMVVLGSREARMKSAVFEINKVCKVEN